MFELEIEVGDIVSILLGVAITSSLFHVSYYGIFIKIKKLYWIINILWVKTKFKMLDKWKALIFQAYRVWWRVHEEGPTEPFGNHADIDPDEVN